MTVTIPDAFREFVSAQIASGHFSNVDELVCSLLQQEQARAQRALIDRQLLDVLNGESTEMTAADWDEIRTEVQRKQMKRNGSRP